MELEGKLHQAAEKGDEAAVRQLLAAGARADQVNLHGSLPLHRASHYGHEGVVRLLLEAAPATASAVNSHGKTPLHCAADSLWSASGGVVRLLLSAAPATATLLTADKRAPIHWAAYHNHVEATQLLLEAAPELAFAPEGCGYTPLHMVLFNPDNVRALRELDTEVAETARCLLRAAPAVQTALGILLQYSQHSATLYADLMARLSLSEDQWHSIPAPCPGLARALPAVLQCSAAEAGWLVGRLADAQRARLRAAALSLARPQQQSSAVLPAELSGRILALCLLDP
ncbi:hypothetical protein CHLNCDRAFT_135974 [Chlorella variabilis]|uniref:Uncharacterized protein n=1 Tax=Chlorella variabilis TaxID=554065 RepID=E1ZJH3_CHLVA|nr:hypothetical protein CHLNCDRAFT_135974 [Chlorella variabilis]EFN53863.1 hypothetical protein CHLNCDRAFT_135974 [Chlorella variabilis]|eukprot:XP_005845965.1 hypothetical protein CHLNCDRAFT_135974 [Chlorella variabilis]